jgi:FkbM family methyltransferase
MSYRFMRALEAVALVLRRLGLAALVEAVRDRVLVAFGPFEAQIGPARLSGAGVPHLAYFRQLRSGREGFMAQQFADAVRPGAVVADLGAHLGYMTQLAAARGARVYAFEPNPETRALLERGLDRAGFADRVEVVPRALAERNGARRLFTGGGGDTSSLYSAQGSEGEVTIDCVRGDEFFGTDVRLDVVKMDIEGGEVAALEGLHQTLARSAPDLVVFAECNPEALAAAGSTAEDLVASLREQRLEVFVCDEQRRELVAWDEAGVDGDYVNLYARRAGDAA